MTSFVSKLGKSRQGCSSGNAFKLQIVSNSQLKIFSSRALRLFKFNILFWGAITEIISIFLVKSYLSASRDLRNPLAIERSIDEVWSLESESLQTMVTFFDWKDPRMSSISSEGLFFSLTVPDRTSRGLMSEVNIFRLKTI